MAVYLDIDADFLFAPRSNGTLSGIAQEVWISPENLVRAMEKAGLRWQTSHLHLFTDHKEAYFAWLEEEVASDTVIHVDAHSDLYDSFPWMIHCGNFLRKGAERGKFAKIIWAMPSWLYKSGDWRKYDLPAFHSGRRQTSIETVPLENLRLPVTQVKLVTLATSPLFVPENGLPWVKKLANLMVKQCRCFRVRPNIPLCIGDPLLSHQVNTSLGYLWSEHQRMVTIEREKRNNVVA